jgi:Transposase
MGRFCCRFRGLGAFRHVFQFNYGIASDKELLTHATSIRTPIRAALLPRVLGILFGAVFGVRQGGSSLGISEATFYNWKKKYGGLGPDELRRLRQLEEENSRLKQIVADLTLDKQMLQDVLKKKL